jgi:hypothetical protein
MAHAVDDRKKLSAQANGAVDQLLASSEVVRLAIPGPSGHAVVATDDRLFLIKKG